MSWGFERGCAGCFWLMVTHEAAVKISVGAAVNEGLTEAGRYTSKSAGPVAIGRKSRFLAM